MTKPHEIPEAAGKFVRSAKQDKPDANVTGVDNRGTDDFPYGFVYFSDHNRLAFGDVRDGIGAFGLFESNWGPVGIPYYRLAIDALTELFPVIAAEYKEDHES